MLTEVSGICQHCSANVTVLMMNGEVLNHCESCEESPFAVKAFEGIIYVVSNPHQTGVKVGLTTKSIEERCRSLNSTGVPGSFEPIAIFPSNNLRTDEKRVHQKLMRHRIAKEHFDLDSIDAVLSAYRALNKREPIFFDSTMEETFQARLAQAKAEMKLRLLGRKA